MKKLIYISFILFFIINPCYSIDKENNSFFDLINLAGNILNTEDIKTQNDENFELVTSSQNKFNQGNTSVAYSEYSTLLDATKTDFGYLNLAKTLYDLGFFSLADKSLSNIKNADKLQTQIQDIKNSYIINYKLTHDEEIYLARAYSSIYYDNSPAEVALDIIKKDNLLEKSDYANYIMANAQAQTKQFKGALSSINKAISKSPKNNVYLLFKTKIYILQNNPKSAIKFIENLQKHNIITTTFKNDFLMQKNQALSVLSQKTSDKAYYIAENYYLQNNIYEAKTHLEDIIGINKKNYKALTLLGFCYLKLNDITLAKEQFEKSFEINKNYSKTLEGLGDIEFINFKYQQALIMYEKAISKNNKNTSAINKAIIASVFSKNDKKTEKYTKLSSKIDNKPFFELYDISDTTLKYIPNDSADLSLEYVKKSIIINPVWLPSLISFAKTEIKEGNFIFAKNIIDSASVIKSLDYNFYYAKALLYYNIKNTKEAIKNVDYSLNLNPYDTHSKELKFKLSDSL